MFIFIIDQLNSELMEMFVNPERVYKDDVALVLDDYMEANFNTICEDGSSDEVGDLLCLMWRQCTTGDFTLVHNALAREFVRNEAEILGNSQGLTADGDVDDGEDMDEENDNNVGTNNLEIISEEVDAAITSEDQPVVDSIGETNTMPIEDDGWETVHRGKSSKVKSRTKSYKI